MNPAVMKAMQTQLGCQSAADLNDRTTYDERLTWPGLAACSDELKNLLVAKTIIPESINIGAVTQFYRCTAMLWGRWVAESDELYKSPKEAVASGKNMVTRVEFKELEKVMKL